MSRERNRGKQECFSSRNILRSPDQDVVERQGRRMLDGICGMDSDVRRRADLRKYMVEDLKGKVVKAMADRYEWDPSQVESYRSVLGVKVRARGRWNAEVENSLFSGDGKQEVFVTVWSSMHHFSKRLTIQIV